MADNSFVCAEGDWRLVLLSIMFSSLQANKKHTKIQLFLDDSEKVTISVTGSGYFFTTVYQ